MEITLMIRTITAMILIETSLLIWVAADTSDIPKLSPRTGFLMKRKISADDDSDVLPLSYDIFTKEVSDLLSPDMFSQTNPISYLLAKVKKLPRDIRYRVNEKLLFKLHGRDLPRRYVPYAEILASLMSSIVQLGSMKTIIPLLERDLATTQSNYTPKRLDTSVMEPELSPLFSSYVFSDKNPPFRLLGKLLEIPENDISKVKTQLENFMKSRKFPRRYSRYTKSLLLFLKQGILQRLKTNAAKIHLTQIANPPASIQTTIENAWEDDESNPDVSDSSQATDLFSLNDDRAGKPTRFCSEIVQFLSPDMFSQANPLAYFLYKAVKLNKDAIQSIHFYLSYHLEREDFPQKYIPYAELASSLLSCLIELEPVNRDIRLIRGNIDKGSDEIKTDISTLDSDLWILFSPKIILKAPKPSINVLEILINITEDEISEVVTRLKELGKDYRFPYLYGNYNAHIWKFLESENQSFLRLQDDIDEMERILDLNTSTSADDEIPVLKSR